MVSEIHQFEVYWVALDPTQGSEMGKTRPCVVITPDEINRHWQTIIVVPVTSTVRGYAFRVPCNINGKAGNMALDQTRAVDRTRLQSKLAELSSNEISDLQHTLNEMFCQ